MGTVLFDKRGVSSGQFAFTTKEDGDYKACFTAKGRLQAGGLSRPALAALRDHTWF